MNRLLTLTAAALLIAQTARADERARLQYRETIDRVANMVGDGEAQSLASRYGMQVLNVMWEDTGRFQGSSVGPNISDVTIEVAEGNGDDRKLALMPVVRFPNFSDKTADVRLDRFYLRVGNEREGQAEQVITLKEFLDNPTRYLSFPGSGHIKGRTLLAARDTHALVSAQAAFLPVPQGGKATFYPVIFNYQSTRGNPAVLTILVTRQGTSATIIDNARDTSSGSWGQRLFFNAEGKRAPLTAERLSDVQQRGQTSNGEAASSLGEDANLLMLIQVPLIYRQPPRRSMMYEGAALAPSAAAPMMEKKSAARDDMEVAVLGHGALEGPYTELDGLTIERDPRFPVRVTVQFYQATSSANISAASMQKLAQQISKVYDKGDYIGSLVVQGPYDGQRPTNWTGTSGAPNNLSWWDFPGLVERWRTGGGQPKEAVGLR